MNHEKNFLEPGIVYTLGVCQLLFCFIFETINMIVLFSKTNVYLTLVSYLTVTLLKDLSSIYYDKTIGSESDNVLVGVFSEESCLEITNHTADIPYKDRSFFSKLTRATYKLFRSVYASIVFYFVPFLYIVFNQNMTVI